MKPSRFSGWVLIFTMSGLAFSLSTVSILEALEWSAQSQLGIKGEFNDNLLLNTLPHDSVYGMWVSPQLQGNLLTENFQIRGTGHLDFIEFLNNKNLNITQQFYDGSLAYQWEKVELGVNGGFTRDSLLQSELQETGVIGIVGTRRTRKLSTVQPTATYILTERTRVSGAYAYTDVVFETGPQTGFNNYVTNTGTFNMFHQILESTQLRMSGQYSNFYAPSAQNLTSAYGGDLEIGHALSETLNVSFFGGAQFVSSKFPSGTTGSQRDNHFVWVFGGSVQKQFEQMKVELNGSQNIRPSGIGRLNQVDRGHFSIFKTLTEHITASLSVDLVHTKTLSQGNVTIPTATTLYITPTMTWNLTEDLSSQLSYVYRHLDRNSSQAGDQVATSNGVFLQFFYRFPRLATSD